MRQIRDKLQDHESHPMTVRLGKPRKDSIPIHTVDRAGFAASAQTMEAGARGWLKTLGFTGAPDTHALLPAADG